MVRAYIVVILLILSLHTAGDNLKPGSYYVSADRLSVRLGPDLNAKITNTLDKQQKVQVFEASNGWARISKYYDGSSENQKGKVARWVSSQYVSVNMPNDDSVLTAESPLEKSIKDSDDYVKHRNIFLKVSKRLVNSGRCNVEDYKTNSGWTRSSNHKNKAVYFTYCGGFLKRNRIYIDAKNGSLL